jgi:hypothetical protein
VCHDLPSFDDYEDVFIEQPVVLAIVLIPSAMNSQMVIDSPLYDDYKDDFHEKSVDYLISGSTLHIKETIACFNPHVIFLLLKKKKKMII